MTILATGWAVVRPDGTVVIYTRPGATEEDAWWATYGYRDRVAAAFPALLGAGMSERRCWECQHYDGPFDTEESEHGPWCYRWDKDVDWPSEAERCTEYEREPALAPKFEPWP